MYFQKLMFKKERKIYVYPKSCIFIIRLKISESIIFNIIEYLFSIRL